MIKESKVEVKYMTPKSWKKNKKSNKELLEDYNRFGLSEQMKMREADRRLEYSRLQRLEKRVDRIQEQLKLLSEVLLKFVDDNTDARTSFKSWYRRRKVGKKIGEKNGFR